MKTVEYLKFAADIAFAEFKTSIEGVSEGLAWSVLPNTGDDYLHSDGSIHGLVLHVATGKKMYASVAFRNTELRWRDIANEVEAFEPSWDAAVAYLEEAQQYWLASWAGLTDEALDMDAATHSGKVCPAWKSIDIVTHHDSYHAGQITVLRYALKETTKPPPSVTEDLRNCCPELATW